MSVFGDFQKAWAQRFPGCELPQAWEEDVRANLTKHRQKVAALNEELEKEEFYVAYLEQILADVERVKQNPRFNNSDSETNSQLIVESSVKDPNFKSDDTKVSDTNSADLNSDSDMQQSKTEKICKTHSTEVSDQNSYITVISVGGSSTLNGKEKSQNKSEENKLCNTGSWKRAENKENSNTESGSNSPLQKKKPPAPPKKPRKSIPVQAVPPVQKADIVTAVDTKLNSEPVNSRSLGNSCEDVNSSLVNTSDSDIISNGPSPTSTIASSIIYEPKEINESFNALVDENKNEDDSYLDENIYDTVAPDEGDISNLSIITNEENKNEPEGDYVVFSEAFDSPRECPPPISSRSRTTDSLLSSQRSVEESPEYATYMNIDYFLQNQKRATGKIERSYSVGADSDDEPFMVCSSDHEIEPDHVADYAEKKNSSTSAPTDDVFDMDSGVYSSSVESTSFLTGTSTPPSTKKNERKTAPSKSESERAAMFKCILGSIAESETVYLECLNMLIQYMKALKSTIGTSQPLLSLEDYNVIFYRIPELHSLHTAFLKGLKKQIENWDGTHTIGEDFKILASKLGVYGSFLQNYSKAIETVRKCSVDNLKFSEITKSIKLKALQGQATTLEDLLHKPVARVQKNALVLHDLLQYTPENHPDYKTLRTALKMTQCFLNDINVSATESMFPVTDRAQRHLVKNSFIVELSEGHRKLRHLFLFSDVIVCARYKPSTRQKFTFEVKWFIPLSDVVILETSGDAEPVKENSPFDILSLKSRASNIRDQILKEERGKEKRVAGRNIDKHKKKLAELEAQLVLASPNLLFRISQKCGKNYTFFLSSEFERAQWIEAISILQSTATPSTTPINPYELQAWVTSCRKHLGTNLGSFLLRSGKDEDLLVGDLHIVVQSLHGLTRPSDVYLCFEVDSYGHFFNKIKTKTCFNSMEPVFNQDFVIDLEGSQTLRILCYENSPQGPILRGKGALELSQSWLTDRIQEKSVSLQELMLTVGLKYIPPELSLRRIPSSKSGGVFGVKIQQVCKKEKSPVPFIIMSCIREVEKRGIHEIGIYRVSGSASDVQRLKKSFETNVYEAEQLLKEVDIHSVTGMFKMYLRELPEALFTDLLYQKFFQAFSLSNHEEKNKQLLQLFEELPEPNKGIIIYLLDHLVRIHQSEATNKMSLHNLATVFGPTLLRPGSRSSSSSPSDLLTAGTVDVMAQAGIFYFFLKRHAAELSLKLDPED
ncbi:active breakpoint cluster region-related protein-like [Argiope bruennichi]|uniref:Active breakpoint cluster region-related protein like n=1 Tax=Argiope bruennichi TaxID=94029 RepID=A0A8T0FVA4_ARGBR|nr:active breakpoint cluster region-related protein-like [Argiope bruennichi]KAF8794205.1 Active breakpoint cluster region-related protein like [Argiope bruennichi]